VRRASATGLLLTTALAGAVFCFLVGSHVLLHPARAAVGLNPASDFQVMTWSLKWWPYAIGHGLNPLHTRLLWPPEGFSTLWMTTIPLLSGLALPVTLTAGSLVAYNVLMFLAVVLAAGAGYLLCRELTGRAAPAVIGGLLFGLSPYMVGHSLSQHLDLVFVFPLPLLALLVVRFLRGRTSPSRFVSFYALLLLGLLGTSFELFLDTALLTAIGVVLAVLDRRYRRAALNVGGLVAIAYAVCLPLLVAIDVLALRGPQVALQYPPADYSIDLLNVVVPTPTLLVGGTLHFARDATRHFVANIGEQDGYLGIPLLILVALALRAEWRRAWLIGAVAFAALLLSLGPILTIGGRPEIGMAFTTAQLPVLDNALPARLSVFTALGAACLCALWISRPGWESARVVFGIAVLLTMLPNFVAPHRLLRAWARSDEFGWSTRKVALGFVGVRDWQRLVRPQSTVLVLPAGAATQAGYWQARANMSFALAAPVTPFVPRGIAAEPIVRGIVEDVPPSLAAPRLRAYLLSDGITSVFGARNADPRWRRAAARATSSTPIAFRDAELYRVPRTLRPLRATTTPIEAFASTFSACNREHVRSVRMWLRFDGRRARLEVQRFLLNTVETPVSLSSASGDADMPALAVGRCGDVAVVFTEWRDGVLELRAASFTDGRWRVATLDRRTQPMWSPNVVIARRHVALATWIDEDAPQRTLRVSALHLGGSWERPLTLERADGLGARGVLTTRHRVAVLAWRDQVASESRIRVATYTAGGWRLPVTLARGLSILDDISVGGLAATVVRWNEETLSDRPVERFEAQLEGSSWRVSALARTRNSAAGLREGR
jgi:hypothetical protein